MTLSLLDGRANGLRGLSDPSCDGLRTKGDCLSGESRGEAGFADGAKVLIGDVGGVAARTVEGDLVIGDSGRLKGEGRGENDMSG